MARKMTRVLVLMLALCCATLAFAAPAKAPVIPVIGTVTVVDLGANYCVPCKLMAPILKEVEREYKGRAAVVFVDVTKNETLARSLGVRVIPTQIFYDKTGQEVARHEGYMDKKTLAGQLDKLLAQ